MLKKIKEICLSLAAFSLIAVPLLVPATVFAADNTTIINDVCSGSNLDATGNSSNCDTNNNGQSLNAILAQIIKIFSIIVGFISVVMIIIGGIKYITSGGDSGNVSGAKNTIIYAIIGLIVVVLAQVLVHFVLNSVNNAANA